MSATWAAFLRALQLLLIVRVIATPVALSPTEGVHHWESLLVARTCAWAAHQSRVGSPGLDTGRSVKVAPASPVPAALLVGDASAVMPVGPISLPGAHARRPLARLRC
jgi:hypothetical protein